MIKASEAKLINQVKEPKLIEEHLTYIGHGIKKAANEGLTRYQYLPSKSISDPIRDKILDRLKEAGYTAHVLTGYRYIWVAW